MTDVFWREVAKSRFAPERGRRRRSQRKAELIFVWGGDGMVQRCIDVIAGTRCDAWRSSLPARRICSRRTSASRRTSRRRSTIGLSGHARRIDVGRLNGERFAVMAGAGFDARMIGDADGGLKDRVGRLAYVWTGAKHLREKPFRAKIKVDGARWYDGDASCILLGNVGKLFGGVEAFEDAHPDDGVLELGVVSADGVREWAGTVARAVVGTAEQVAARRRPRRCTPCASSSIARCSTRSTAATARRCASCASTSSPRPCRSACPPRRLALSRDVRSRS